MVQTFSTFLSYVGMEKIILHTYFLVSSPHCGFIMSSYNSVTDEHFVFWKFSFLQVDETSVSSWNIFPLEVCEITS